MDLPLTDEQKMVRESIDRFFTRIQPRHAGHLDSAGKEKIWRAACAAGWANLFEYSADTSVTLGAVESALVLHGLGRSGIALPLNEVMVARRLLRNKQAKTETEGDAIVLPVLGPAAGDVTLTMNDDGNWISGSTTHIGHAGMATRLIVEAGGCLIEVSLDPDRKNLEQVVDPDGSQSGRFHFDNLPGSSFKIIAGPDDTPVLSAWAQRHLELGAAAECIGLMESTLELTLEHLKTRQQFGAPLGSFQALQHQAADNFINLELCRSLVYFACRLTDRKIAKSSYVAAARAKAGRAALDVTKSAIQLHGAIGYSEEHVLGQYLRRAMAMTGRHNCRSDILTV